jgi:hypothetical protein
MILVVVTIAVHVSGIALIAVVVPRIWTDDVSGRKSFFDTVPGTVVAITAIAVVLAILHGIEAVIWAFVYLRLGVLTSMPDAILYSLGAMSTAGSGLNVQVQWRLMGVIESFGGVLLFGISTAFLFSLMRFLWRSVALRQRPESVRQ